MLGSNGIYRLYRRHVDDHEKTEQRLVGVFAIVNHRVHIMEDHGGIMEDMVPPGPLDESVLYRLFMLSRNPYWRLVHENDIQAGNHPDLQEQENGNEDQ
jgi:hypothetical protein